MPSEAGAGKDLPSRGTRLTRPPDPRFKAAALDPGSVPQIKDSEPLCGPSPGWEAEVEPDRVAVLQETDQRHWGTFSQERAEGVHRKEHLC